MVVSLYFSKMHHPIQMKPADTDKTNGERQHCELKF